MRTYRQLMDFVTSNGITHECVPMMSAYTEIYQEGGKTMASRKSVNKGYRFGMVGVCQGKAEEWIWFKCADRELRDTSAFFFEQRYSPRKNRAYRGIRERQTAYAALNKRERK